jgi:hypothetical protein
MMRRRGKWRRRRRRRRMGGGGKHGGGLGQVQMEERELEERQALSVCVWSGGWREEGGWRAERTMMTMALMSRDRHKQQDKGRL